MRHPKCRTYRYTLSRIWDDSKQYALFIGLNPSTVDETEDDLTIRRCIRFARDWDFGGLYMLNLFAYRATKSPDMKAANDPIGPDNDKWLTGLAAHAGIVVAARGNGGSFLNRSLIVRRMIPNVYCLKLKQVR